MLESNCWSLELLWTPSRQRNDLVLDTCPGGHSRRDIPRALYPIV